MKKEIKEKWLTALRSGEYPQAREVMSDGTGYCCLGVLCKISGFEPNGESFIDNCGNEIDAEFYKTQLEYFDLSKAHHNHLIDMNDKQRCDFATIADYIEKNIPTY